MIYNVILKSSLGIRIPLRGVSSICCLVDVIRRLVGVLREQGSHHRDDDTEPGKIVGS